MTSLNDDNVRRIQALSARQQGKKVALACHSQEPYCYKVFKDFAVDTTEEAVEALRNLALTPSYKLDWEHHATHLEPIIQRSDFSTGKLGKLSTRDVKKLLKLGSCKHRKIAILLLEPTKYSDETINQIDSYLQFASNGKLDSENTAIINCRALIPNASFTKSYKDNSSTGEYNFRGVTAAIKELKPDVIIMCQCSVDKDVDSFVARLTRSKRSAGEWTLVKMQGKYMHVVQAFLPSSLEKYQEPRAPNIATSADFQESLLKFCFVLAVNLAEGIDVVGPGLEKLRNIALAVGN